MKAACRASVMLTYNAQPHTDQSTEIKQIVWDFKLDAPVIVPVTRQAAEGLSDLSSRDLKDSLLQYTASFKSK